MSPLGDSRCYVHLFLRGIQTQIEISSPSLGLICMHTLEALRCSGRP